MRLSPRVFPLSSWISKAPWLPWRLPPRQPPLPRVVMNSWNPVQRIKALKWRSCLRREPVCARVSSVQILYVFDSQISFQILSSHFEEKQEPTETPCKPTHFSLHPIRVKTVSNLLWLLSYAFMAFLGMLKLPLSSFLKDQDDMSHTCHGRESQSQKRNPRWIWLIPLVVEQCLALFFELSHGVRVFPTRRF